MKTADLLILGAAGLAAAGAAWTVRGLPTPTEPAVVEVASLPRAASVARAPQAAVPPSVPDEAWSTLPSGLQVAELAPGEGPLAGPGMLATCDYTLWTADGRLVDTSDGRPVAHPVIIGRRQVIRGWDEALPGMRAGGRRLVRIPAALGYGASGTAGVPGGTDLLLDLRLVSLSPPRAQPELPAGAAGRLRDLGEGRVGLDLSPGSGDPTAPGTLILLDYTVWSPEGGALYTTWGRSAPGRFTVGSPGLTPAIDALVRGMRPGGRRLARVEGLVLPGVELPAEPVLVDLVLSAPTGR